MTPGSAGAFTAIEANSSQLSRSATLTGVIALRRSISAISAATELSVMGIRWRRRAITVLTSPASSRVMVTR